MKKPKLEDRIIGKVYRMEAKKTIWYIASRVLIFILGVLVVFILLSVAYDIYREQGSFDLINFYGDDIEAIQRSFMGNLWIFMEETPREIIVAILLTSTVLVYLIGRIILNFGRIRNKLVSIYKFYKNKS